jgi:hypothetical protein
MYLEASGTKPQKKCNTATCLTHGATFVRLFSAGTQIALSSLELSHSMLFSMLASLSAQQPFPAQMWTDAPGAAGGHERTQNRGRTGELLGRKYRGRTQYNRLSCISGTRPKAVKHLGPGIVWQVGPAKVSSLQICQRPASLQVLGQDHGCVRSAAGTEEAVGEKSLGQKNQHSQHPACSTIRPQASLQAHTWSM